MSRPWRRPARPRLLAAAVLAAVPAVALPRFAWAAPEEVQVYRDEVTPLHRFGVELNQSYVPGGPVEDIGPIAQVGLYRLTPELNFGIARGWEVGSLVETTVRSGAFDVHGIKAHARWIAPRPEGQAWYMGLNGEVGWSDRHLEERPWTVELRGIAGWEAGRWVLAVNPTLETAADGRGGEPVAFELQTKVGYRVSKAWLVGMESYNAFGPIARIEPLNRQSQIAYAVADGEWRGLDLNFGVGKGLTHASDGWAVKAVIGIPLGAR
jgi:hypothetical protein